MIQSRTRYELASRVCGRWHKQVCEITQRCAAAAYIPPCLTSRPRRPGQCLRRRPSPRMAGAKQNRKTQFELPLRNRRDGVAIRIPLTPAISVCSADQRLDSRPDGSLAGSAWAADTRTCLCRAASNRFSESRTRHASIGNRIQARGTRRHGKEGAAITVPIALELGSTCRMAPVPQAARNGRLGGGRAAGKRYQPRETLQWRCPEIAREDLCGHHFSPGAGSTRRAACAGEPPEIGVPRGDATGCWRVDCGICHTWRVSRPNGGLRGRPLRRLAPRTRCFRGVVWDRGGASPMGGAA